MDASGASGRAGWPTGRPGSVCRAAGQLGQARTRERGGRAPKKEAAPALGRNWGGFRTQHILANRQGRLLHLRVPGDPRHDRTQGRAREAA